MKKTIFAALAAGALVLAGCTKTEVTEVPEGRAIGFTNYVANSVKSIDGKAGLTKFFVYGELEDATKVFNGQEVTWVNNTSTADYSPTRYWIENKTYKFAAYSNENGNIEDGDGTVSFNYNGSGNAYLTFTDYVVADGKKDLVYAQTGQQSYQYTGTGTMDPVELEFKHILSMIEFNFTKDESLNGHNLTIKDIKVEACSTGTYNSPSEDNSWTEGTGKHSYTFTTEATISGSTTDADGVTPVETSLILLPQAITDYKVTFTLEWYPFNADGTENTSAAKETESYSVDISGTVDNEWKPGYHYTYTATINAKNLNEVPIVFTVQDDFTWEKETGTSGEITFE